MLQHHGHLALEAECSGVVDSGEPGRSHLTQREDTATKTAAS